MACPRFFVDLPLTADTGLDLPDEIAHHAVRVLRLRDGDPMILFNGQGGEFPARLEVQGKHASALIGAFDAREAELPAALTLVQGIASGDKMDWVIEKCVEVGVTTIHPVAAVRSVLRLSGERLEKRLAHWQRIAQAACEQSGRNRIPRILPPLPLDEVLRAATPGPLRVMCDPAGEARLTELARQDGLAQGLELFVGPEGGWSPEEMAAAARHGVQSAQFGARVLRTETAGCVLIAAVSAAMGWV